MCATLYVHGKLSTTLYKIAFVGNEQQMLALMYVFLKNAQITNAGQNDILQMAQLLRAPSAAADVIDLRCIHMNGLGQMEVGCHQSGLYYATILYQGGSEDILDKLISIQKQVGVFIQVITTGTYRIGYGGADYTIVDGEIVDDYELYREMAYVLYCRHFASNMADSFLELIKDLQPLNDQNWISAYQSLAFVEDGDEEDLAERVALHYLFECHKGAVEDLALLGVLCAGFDDRNCSVKNWEKADALIQSAESSQVQTAGMLLRLIHNAHLDEATGTLYQKTVKRRKKTATALAVQKDRDHWLKKLMELDAVHEPEAQLKRIAPNDKCAELLKQELSRNPGPAVQAALTGKEKRIEIYRPLGENDVCQLINYFDQRKAVVLHKTGEVTSEYPELNEWKNITQIYCVCGILVGLTEAGSLLCHATVTNAPAIQMAEALRTWTDIVALASNMYAPFDCYPHLKPEDGFCIGLKKDGTLVSCGKKLRGEPACAAWPGAKQVFTDKNSYGIVTQDGRICAFGRLSHMESLQNVVRVENYGTTCHTVHFADGTATYYKSETEYYPDIHNLKRFGRVQWVASCGYGFRTDAEFCGYQPKPDGLTIDGSELRLRKYGIPVDFVCLNNTGTGALAVLYEKGNVRLFTAGRKAGEIIAKKVTKIAVEDGAIVAYC